MQTIRACASLLFVLTPDSVADNSVCKAEWTRALRYKKPIVPLLLHPDAELPFRLSSRQWIDFTGNFQPALAKLRNHLAWLASPEGGDCTPTQAWDGECVATMREHHPSL